MKTTIKGTPYNVEFVENAFMFDNQIAAGAFDYENKQIKVATHTWSTERVLLHELTHAYFAECGLASYATDETLVDWFAMNAREIFENAQKILAAQNPPNSRELKKGKNEKKKKE